VRRAGVAAAAAAAVALSGCYTIRYERRGVSPEAGAPRESWKHGVLGGTIPASRAVDLAATCPDGVATVESQVTAYNAVGQLLTSFGALLVLHAPLWEPTTVRVVCARPTEARAAGKRTKLVVLPLAPLGGVTEERARLLGDALAGELRRRPGVSVVTQSDVAALLGVEKTRQMLGCTESGCMAEIGGALGADRVVHGSLGRVGGSLVVNLSALDARRSTVLASVSQRLRGGEDEAFLDALPAIADALLAAPAAR
jgi:TolB-like protein